MLPSVLAPPADFLPLVAALPRALGEAAGRAPADARVGCCNHVHVAATSQQARERWRPYYANYLRFVDRVWTRRELIHAKARVELDYERLLAGVAVCGSPAEVVDRIAATARDARARRPSLDVRPRRPAPRAAVAETLELFADPRSLPQLR